MKNITLSEVEKDFIEKRGLMSEADGQPRIMGRMWGLLLVVDSRLTAAQMAELLQVSRGSVSTNLKLLSMLGVVSKSTRPGEREAYYGISEHPYWTFIETMRRNSTENLSMVEAARGQVENEAARKKLELLANFYRLLEDAYGDLMVKLK